MPNRSRLAAASIMVSASRPFVPEPVPVCVPEIGHGHGHAHGHELSLASLRGRNHDQRLCGQYVLITERTEGVCRRSPGAVRFDLNEHNKQQI